MQTRMLGNSNIAVTRLGCGAWAIGGTGWEYAWGPQKDDDSIAAIHRSLELGVNWIDTAAVYGLGHSEEVVSRALADWAGSRPYVFTKCGLVWDRQGRLSRKLAAATVRQECEASLARLRVETIDLYQVHWPPENDAELEEGWAELALLKGEGESALDRSFELQRGTDGAGEGDRSGHIAPAALFTGASRRPGRDPSLLQSGGDRRHRVRAHGLGSPVRRHDARACRVASRRRLAAPQSGIQ